MGRRTWRGGFSDAPLSGARFECGIGAAVGSNGVCSRGAGIMASNCRNDDGSAPQATQSTSIQRMDAFDKLPKSVRQELAVALLDYTAIDFHYHYRQGM